MGSLAILIYDVEARFPGGADRRCVEHPDANPDDGLAVAGDEAVGDSAHPSLSIWDNLLQPKTPNFHVY